MTTTIPISKYCEITSSKRIFAEEYQNSGTPFYRGKEISLLSKGEKITDPIYINEEKYLALKEKFGVPQKGDLLMTAVGTIGNIYRVQEGDEFYFKDGNVIWFRNFRNINTEWLYYWLSSPEGKNALAKCTIGSSQKAYTIDNVSKLGLPDISLESQDAISEVISSYDALIKVKREQVSVLEETAQRLYTEWFVNFKFPAHESVKMVDSGTKLGKIPEGWRVVNIEALLDSVKRKKKFKTSEYQEKGLYPIVDQGSDFFGGYTDDAEAVYKETLIVFGDHSRCFKYCNFDFACGADGTQLLKSNDMERMPQSLLYFSVKNAGLTDYKYARHFKFLKVLPILLPNKEVAGAFASIIDKNFDLIQNLSLQSKVLSEMRDLLIPQLMTGKRELK